MDNPVLQAIRARRSIRRYQSVPLEQKALDAILEAGRFAPSGGNNQTSHFLVIRNPQVLADLKALVVREFAAMEYDEKTYPSLVHSIRRSREGAYDFIFNAPVLVVAANRKGYGNAMADCACALENMMLAATSLEVGSCWINQLRWLDGNPAVRAFLENLGLDGGETVCGGLALGYSGGSPQSPLERKGNPITYVD